MAYEVKFTDFVNKGAITVEEDDINAETSLSLVGRNETNYGRVVNENFLHLLENFANTSAPINPVEGQLWYDTTENANQLKIYDGTQWVSAGGLKKAATEPEVANSTLGDLWVNTATQQLFLYSGSGWILVGPSDAEGTGTGSRTQIIQDTNNQDRVVIVNYINNKVVSVVSADQFTAKNANDLPGYSNIDNSRVVYPGVNLSKEITGTGNLSGITTATKYYGVASTAQNLLISGNTVPSTEFARLNTANTFTRAMTINNNDGITVGNDTKLKLSVAGSVGELRNGASDGSIDLKVRNAAGILSTILRVSNNERVVIGTPTGIPAATLDVRGNAIFAGDVIINSTDPGVETDFGPGALTVAENITSTGGNLDIFGTASIGGEITLNNIVASDVGKNIGSAILPFDNIFANRFTGAFTGDVSGSVTGSSSTAGRLSSPTSFEIVGDITAPPISFDGSGVLTKTFTTTLSDSFFTDKDEIETTALTTDTILVNRDGVGLRTINQENLLGVIPNASQGPLVPIGTILPFGGTTAPAGWLLCDGTEYSIASYELLYAVIGASFGISSNPAVAFLAPDMRGRSLLGRLSGASGSNRVLNDGAANTIGNYGGDDRQTLSEDQLPEHYHSLQGDAGTQFYATNNDVTGALDSATTDVQSADGGLTGSGITRTEGISDRVVAQEDVKTVSPFATVNFIIYHGVF